jgi:hypothetical protein
LFCAHDNFQNYFILISIFRIIKEMLFPDKNNIKSRVKVSPLS